MGGDDVIGEWVEMKENSRADRLVFQRIDTDISPMRGGRRRLHLMPDGRAEAMAPGAVDKPERTGAGKWARAGSFLHLDLHGWDGNYEIDTVDDRKLILRRR
jgi:hypothetical protein